MRSRGRRIRALAMMVAIGAWTLGVPTGAVATHCETEETIFWGNTKSDGTFNTSTHGAWNVILLKDRDLNFRDCGSRYMAWSTAHVRLNLTTIDWVEIGWKEAALDANTHVWAYFVEWGRNGSTLVNQSDWFPCTLNAGTYGQWRVHNPIGTTDWQMQLNCNDGTGWHTLSTWSSSGDSTGTAMAETGRLGGEPTGMKDSQKSLRWKDGSGVWKAWLDMRCQSDNATNWDAKKVSSSEYTTLKVTSDPTPTC